MQNTKDRDSVFYQVKTEGKLTEMEMFHDLIALLSAGFDTSSSTAGGTLYHLRSNPKCLEKLVLSLQEQLNYDPNS